MPRIGVRLLLTLGILTWSGVRPGGCPAAPATVVIQGRLETGAAPAPAGTRQFRIRFFDAQTAGTQVGSDVNGTVTLTSGGRFAIAFVPSTAVQAASEIWYELAIDSPTPADGAIDAEDVFATRIKLHSVPFALLSADSETVGGTPAADMATDDELTSGLAGKADSAHAHDAADIGSGELADGRLPASIARISDILTTLLANDGSGSALDADLLDGSDSSVFATGAELASGLANEVTDRDAAIAAAVAGFLTSPATPAAPTDLRLLPGLRGAPYLKLTWNVGSFGGTANFIAYESSAPITEANKASAIRRFVLSTELELAIFSNSGMRFFRVAALNFSGGEGPLSNEFGLDTTSRIAYRADFDTAFVRELYVSPAAGGGAAVKVSGPLVVGGAVSTDFTFSPDGARIAYAADQDTNNRLELYVAPAGGGSAPVKVNPLLVSGGAVSVTEFAFSPDGSRIAYIADQDTNGVDELYVAPAAGGGASVKVNSALVGGGDVDSFAFSPDGLRIAYLADQDSDAVPELYVAPAAGGGAVARVNPEIILGGVSAGFAFSPDGSRIAYVADQNSIGLPELFVAPAAGGAMPVTVSAALGVNRVVDSFAFSPDGSRIAFRADKDADDVFELYIAPATGGGDSIKVNSTLVSGGDVLSRFIFSPDGSIIVYHADQDTNGIPELYVAPAVGGGAAFKVNPTLASGRSVQTFAFSPDGSRIAYRADQDSAGVFELYVVPAAGGASVKVNPTLVSGGDVLTRISFSPDGSRIAYRADQETDGLNDLYVAPAGGGGATVKINPAPVSGGVDSNSTTFSPLGFTP